KKEFDVIVAVAIEQIVHAANRARCHGTGRRTKGQNHVFAAAVIAQADGIAGQAPDCEFRSALAWLRGPGKGATYYLAGHLVASELAVVVWAADDSEHALLLKIKNSAGTPV